MPFKTTLEAALAHLKAKGIIRFDTDILGPMDLKSKGTVSSYASGATKMSDKFREKFENYYKLKLADFSELVGEPENEEEKQGVDKDILEGDILRLYRQQVGVQHRILADLAEIKANLKTLSQAVQDVPRQEDPAAPQEKFLLGKMKRKNPSKGNSGTE